MTGPRVRDQAAREDFEGLDFDDGFQPELETAIRYYRPDFTDRETPFKDVRDFTS